MLKNLFTTRRCNLCGWSGLRFWPMISHRYIRPDAVCPKCGCLERHRALIGYMLNAGDFSGKTVLDVAPVKGFRSFFESRGARYFSVDLSNPTAVRANLSSAPFRDGVFDIIICYHVLEHIKDDGAALLELKRTLAPGGKMYLQVPINGALDKTMEYGSPDRYCHGHVRDYGKDFNSRLIDAGFNCKLMDMAGISRYPGVKLGINKAVGTTYICTV